MEINQIKEINLKNLLKDWTDPDIAQYYLACCLGLMIYDEFFTYFREAKHIFWTKNQTSTMLNQVLEKLVENDFLEFDEEESKYRWNKSLD